MHYCPQINVEGLFYNLQDIRMIVKKRWKRKAVTIQTETELDWTFEVWHILNKVPHPCIKYFLYSRSRASLVPSCLTLALIYHQKPWRVSDTAVLHFLHCPTSSPHTCKDLYVRENRPITGYNSKVFKECTIVISKQTNPKTTQTSI